MAEDSKGEARRDGILVGRGAKEDRTVWMSIVVAVCPTGDEEGSIVVALCPTGDEDGSIVVALYPTGGMKRGSIVVALCPTGDEEGSIVVALYPTGDEEGEHCRSLISHWG